MIQAHELRIGNYVLLPDRKDPVIVDQILRYEITVLETGRFFNLKHVEPIALTTEWLTKFGFDLIESRKTKNTYKSKDCAFPVYFFSDGVFSMLNPKWDVVLTYVHQLQNLYFALTGEDLKIRKYDAIPASADRPA